MSQQLFTSNEERLQPKILPIHKNLIHDICDSILAKHLKKLPDLSHVVILLSSNKATAYCRSLLLEKVKSLGFPALLGPKITTLDTWLDQFPSDAPKIISNHARELLLIEALRQHSNLYQHASPWALTESLIELFDDLTKSHVQLPENFDDFVTLLNDAYGATQAISSTLGKEALLVHTLWFAMFQQMQSLGYIDRNSAMLIKMGESLQFNSDKQLYYCGIDKATDAEKRWRSKLINSNQLQATIYDPLNTVNTKDSPDFIQFLDRVYDRQSEDFLTRVKSCRQKFPDSPIQTFVKLFAASNAEDEAIAVDIQVRSWLLAGKKQIGIITENRKLARRIRALLERASILVEDSAGWALSTTSAAMVLERWLQTIEENFHYLPLLDCLKSTFVLQSDDVFNETVYQLEQHIIIDENIPSDIQRYLKHIEYRKSKLQDFMPVNYEELTRLLNTIAVAAAPLIEICNAELRPAKEFLHALFESLHQLGVIDHYRQDDAGQQLLEELNKLVSASDIVPIQLDWKTFRNWIHSTLERFNFKTRQYNTPVKLCTLMDSEYYQFDALIIAGAEINFLPNPGKQSAFFNDNVRSTLNLKTRDDIRALEYFQFRRILASTYKNDAQIGPILITRRCWEKDEAIITAPWIHMLKAFHSQTYGSDLTNEELTRLVACHSARVRKDTAALPDVILRHPKVVIPSWMLPKRFSASAYQQLIDCPYQFVAARGYRLIPPDSVKEALQKSDYGVRIHRCLEAFHSPVTGLPQPFSEKITSKNRDAAIARLNEISINVFSADIEDNFMHRGWLRRWQAVLPFYIDWQMQQQTLYSPLTTELNIVDAVLPGNIHITGRIDRIDKDGNVLVIIDYKTGNIPSDNDIQNGEAVQLPFYLLLLLATPSGEFGNLLNQPTDQVHGMYVDLDNDKRLVKSKSFMRHDQLYQLAHSNQNRLQNILDQLRQGVRAPAWGDDATCKRCQMEGLCRKQAWST